MQSFVAATRPEVAPLLSTLALPVERGRIISGARGSRRDFLLTGVGMAVATAIWCAKTLADERYDAALNLGVCGSFNPAHPPPSVVHVTRDTFSELGAEDGDRFLPITELRAARPQRVSVHERPHREQRACVVP